MSAPGLETALARLYADREFLTRFLESPESALAEADLTESERRGLMAIDRAGLAMAARSYDRKRRGRGKPAPGGMLP